MDAVPSNLFLNRIGKLALYLPTAMAIWELIFGATGAVHNFSCLVTCRFLLGFVESAYFAFPPLPPLLDLTGGR